MEISAQIEHQNTQRYAPPLPNPFSWYKSQMISPSFFFHKKNPTQNISGISSPQCYFSYYKLNSAEQGNLFTVNSCLKTHAREILRVPVTTET